MKLGARRTGMLLACGLAALCFAADPEPPTPEPPVGVASDSVAEATLLVEEADRRVRQGTAEEIRAAIAIYERAARLFGAGGQVDGEAAARNRLAEASYYLGDLRRFRAASEEALRLARSAETWREEARALNNLGAADLLRGKIETGRGFLQASLELCRRWGEPADIAGTLGNLGTMFLMVGEGEEALHHFEAALEQVHGTTEEARRERATLLNNMAVVHNRSARWQRALELYRQVLAMVEELGDMAYTATTLNNIALLYRGLGEPEAARRDLERALGLALTAGDRLVEARALINLASLDETADPARALERLRRALPLWREAGARSDEAVTLRRIGTVQLRLGEHGSAQAHLEQALHLAREIRDARGEAATLHELARLHLARADFPRARESLARALELRRRTGDPPGELETRLELARAARGLGELETASEQAERAVELLESVRLRVASDRLRDSVLASGRAVFELAVDLRMELHGREPAAGHLAMAFELSERARARGLLEAVTRRPEGSLHELEPALAELETRLRERIRLKESQRVLLAEKGRNPEVLARLDEDMAVLVSEYRELQGRIRSRLPGALSEPRIPAVREVQEKLLDDRTQLLEYALGEERSFLWVVGRDTVRAFTLPGRAELEPMVRRLADLLSRSHLPTARGQSDLLAAEVSARLLGPAASTLTADRLLIVPDGALHYLPFAALPVPGEASGTVPLIARYEIAHLPSAAVLLALRRKIAARPPAPRTVAVVGDPVFGAEDPRVRGERRRGASGPAFEPSASAPGIARFERLPATRREAEAITALAPDAWLVVDFEASRETVLSGALADYRILHFATHGVLDDRHPELSGLALSLVDEAGRSRDGFLRLLDLGGLRLQADLVVLSACRTGLGLEVSGEGLVGLTRGFFDAGAARVVVSLWAVGDAATAELMERLYRQMLVRGRPPAVALRTAQLSMWREGRWRAPHHWAGFVLLGE